MRTNTEQGFACMPYPRGRQLMADGGSLGLKKHMVHGLIELDITNARKAIRRYRRERGEPLSFSAFFLFCLGRTIEEDRQIQAYRNRRNKLILFNDVDVNMLFEVDVDGQKTIRPHILRKVNRKNAQSLQREMDQFQQEHHYSAESEFIDLFVRLPKWVRRFYLKRLLANPFRLKEYFGTVLVSSLGLFGSGSGWGIPVPNHTLQLTLGGVCSRVCEANGIMESRQFLSVTVSVDHDIVDGLPVARFINRLRSRVEKGPYSFL